jgi:hypothetical protein
VEGIAFNCTFYEGRRNDTGFEGLETRAFTYSLQKPQLWEHTWQVQQ